ncbi:DUF6054 family protein [Niallia taxi]|uniref:DUF6054 family protein n=1 Tax=Niallia taxi TaxID=2499688 RepID=UPI0015F7300B|nr:DUF6054 family protein [Niallia taxi]MCM3214563.1 DUF6054 family protein [Niallia taxi]
MQKPIEFKLAVSPFEAADIILSSPNIKEDLLYWENHVVGNEGKQICTFIFERYYFRTSGRATLTVILENFDGENKVRCMTSGSAESIINIDFGASRNFVGWLKNILAENILKEAEL